ncbi:hypothetical protein [Streptomyces platensis]|uniref:hypothetical protein n=1 Tax=Streptomyces platensis TaxID=58346 RepID=UPI001F443E89|nr:hypothetical protein [Streptomyces platensis]MCF3142132.1 hypothetical protein [Streptomyces platensis]
MSGTPPVAVLRAWTVLLAVRWLPPALPHPDGTIEPLDPATDRRTSFTSSLC